ncbi:unnamed protein product [Prorocentrum cordatum]|uniref:Uncharacterized protein n=1 Tax=Prorocentrum cordatum TaxID=2364126 RepID=A0ABN9R396_9DINO|nr:unnamed protein product [Polarella glacialis]
MEKEDRDCSLSEWADWGACTNPCGGQRTRSRSVLLPPSGKGAPCEQGLALSALEPCEESQSCLSAPDVDCRWGSWGEWGACSGCDGQRQRSRHIEQVATGLGRPCEAAQSEDAPAARRAETASLLRFQKQFDIHAARLEEHDERLDKHDEKLRSLQGELAEFKKLPAVAEERPVVPVAVPSGFARDPDQNLVVAMSQVPTTLAAVKKSFDEWLLSLSLTSDDYKIEAAGPSPTRRFLIKFGGLVAPATRKVQMVLSKLRQNGAWKEFWADVDGAPSRRLHLGPDKSPQQVKQEITLRRCKAALQELCGASSKIFLDRERGILSLGWGEVLRVEVFHGEPPPKSRWVIEGPQKHNITKAQAIAATKAAGEKASLKKNYLARLLPQRTVASLQEPHQGELQLRAPMNQIYPESALITSFAGEGREGRIKVLRVEIQRGDVVLTVFNIHNHGLRSCDIRTVTASINAALRAAQDGPIRKLAVVNGAFNFAADEALILHAPSAAIRRSRRRLHYQATIWRRTLARMLELEGGEPTRYTKDASRSGLVASNGGLLTLAAASSRLDRTKKGSVATDPADRVDALGKYWGLAFAKKPFDAQVFRIMQLAESFANLVLKIPKCKVAPLAGRFSVPLAARVKAAISEAIPTWADLEVTSKLLYLGLWLGPAVGPCDCGAGPVAKLHLRAQAIGRGATPPSVSAILYNTRAVATLSYVAQFAWLPPEFLSLELPTLAQAFRVPLGALSLGSWTQLDLRGGPRIPRRGHVAVASLARAATLTFLEHEQILSSLVAFVEERDDWRALCACPVRFSRLWRPSPVTLLGKSFVRPMVAALVLSALHIVPFVS